MGKKIKSTKNRKQILTKTAALLQVYSITMLVAMTILGCIVFDVIEDKNVTRNLNINSIIEINNESELNDIISKQGSYNVMISGKAYTYAPIKNENVGSKLLYVKTITYDDSGETEEIDRVEFIRIHGVSFPTKTMMFVEPNIITNAIKDNKKIEYQAITLKSDILIYGRIENGILQPNTKVYTTTTAKELKNSMHINTSYKEFFIIWEIMILLIVIFTDAYVLIKKSRVVKDYREKVFPNTKENLGTMSHRTKENYKKQYNHNKQSYKRKEPYRNNERKK